MNVKYQIFISSTYDDLKEERNQVIKATLEMGHIPVGMEMFSAADEEQWKLITKQIDVSDYYVVIIAHRYGSVEKGISYTEKEYDYAIRKGIPTLGFIIEESASWNPKKMESDTIKKEALKKFIGKVEKKPVSLWASTEDLYGKFSISLMKEITANPRPGWVQSSEIVGPDVMRELSRLSGENAALRKEIEGMKRKTESDIIAEQERLSQVLLNNQITVPLYYHDANDWDKDLKKNLSWLFHLLAPELMIENKLEDIGIKIGFHAASGKKLRARWPVPANVTKEWFADLMALGLVTPSTRKHPVKDTGEYWTLTDKGRELYNHLRLLKLYQGAATKEEVIEPTLEKKKPNRRNKKAP